MVRVSLQAALTVSSVVCSGVRWPPNSSARASRCRVRQRTPSSSGWPSDRCMRPAESSSRLRWALHVPERACSSSKSSGVPESMRTTGRAQRDACSGPPQRDACSGPPQREEPVASGTDSIFPFAGFGAGRKERCQHGAANAISARLASVMRPCSLGRSVWFLWFYFYLAVIWFKLRNRLYVLKWCERNTCTLNTY